MSGLLLSLALRFWKPIAGLLAIAAVVLYLMHLGAAHEATKRDLTAAATQLAAAKAQSAAVQKELDAYIERVKRTDAIAQERVKAATRISAVTKRITNEIKTRVPASAPALPGGWRVLHDAAATGVPAPAPSASAPGQPDAAAVSAQDAASTVVDNYGTYHQLANQLSLLQRWVTEACR